MSKRRGVAAALLLAVASPAAASESVTVRTESMEVTFSARHAVPVAWRVCMPDCSGGAPLRQVDFLTAADPLALLVPQEGPSAAAGREYTMTEQETPEGYTVLFESDPGPDGVPVTYRYELPRRGYLARLTIAGTGQASGLRVQPGSGLVPPPMPGFGSFYTAVRAVRTQAGSQEVVEPDADDGPAPVAAGDWAGVRSRFWAFLVSPVSVDHSVTALPGGEGQPAVMLAAPPEASGQREYRIFAGPVAYEVLSTEAQLTGLLFAALWDWLRALCFGLLFILSWLYGMIGYMGLAVIGLSLAVKILISPLTALAERSQRRVNEIQSRLQPRLDEINAGYRGEEHHERIMALYREEGVHPLYAMRGLFGIAIQIPFFIAAFDMLGENFAMHRVGFLWIEDLSEPDRLLALPVEIPFFGAYLNLLPFLMAAVSALAAFLNRDPTLSPELQRRQRRRLFGMSGAFLVLFYTFPAGMVLYWTASNLIHLVKQQSAAWWQGRRAAG